MIPKVVQRVAIIGTRPLAILQTIAVATTLVLVAVRGNDGQAITISMEYSDEGDPLPHDENPSWDPDGAILKAHFEAAKNLWERLLPGAGEYSFDFHWDDDIDGLGLTTDTPLDTYIEIHPNRDWFVDPTPGDHSEFNLTNAQTIYSQLSLTDQTTYFPGTPPPSVLEVGFRGTGVAGPVGVTGLHAQNGRDLFSTVLHEIGHVLGISGVEPGDYNMLSEHAGGLFDVLVLEGDGGHLAGQGVVPFLMCESCGATGVRRFPTATDILVIAEDQGILDVHLDRVDRVASGLWNNTYGWIGGDVPDSTQDVTIRQGGAVTLDVDATVRNLQVHAGSSVFIGPHKLTAADTLNFRTTPIVCPSRKSLLSFGLN